MQCACWGGINKGYALTPLGNFFFITPFHSPSTFTKGFLSLLWLKERKERLYMYNTKPPTKDIPKENKLS